MTVEAPEQRPAQTSGAHELPRFALLAHAVAGRRITVVSGASERAHTDGETIFVPDGPREDVLRDTVAVQAALLAAGSFDPWVMARLTGRRALRLRYLTLEAVRARTLLPPSTRSRLSGIYDGTPPGSARESLNRAAGRRKPVPEAPAWLGTIKPVVVLRANPTGGAPTEDDRSGTSQSEELRELDDEEESESSKILELLAGPLTNPLATMMQKLLGAGRTPSDDQGGGEDMPIGVARHGPVGPKAKAITSPAQAALQLGGTPIGHRYPEWDHHCGRYRPDWCSVAEYDPPPGRSGNPTGTSIDPALRRQLGRLGLTHGRYRRQPMGDSLDLTALVELVVDHAAGHAGDPRVYECNRCTAHDLGVLVLLDVTGSTAESATDGRVFDHQRELAARLTVALDELGDRVATYGFFSRGRDAVRFLRVKDFDDRYDLGAQERLAALRPGGYTRLGAAVRHGSRLLITRAGTSKMMMVVIGDGFPHDDGYRSRYAEEDSHQALREAVAQGIGCVCLSVGATTEDDVIQRVWGEMPHRRLDDPAELAAHVLPLFREAMRKAEASRRFIGSAPDRPYPARLTRRDQWTVATA